MGDELLYRSLLFYFVNGPASTYLCIISHQCYASESNFIFIWTHRKASNLVTSLPITYESSFNVWDNMASIHWWFHQWQSDWSFLNDWHARAVSFNQTKHKSFFDEAFNKEKSIYFSKRRFFIWIILFNHTSDKYVYWIGLFY